MKAEQFKYLSFKTVEDFEEYQTETDDKIYSTRIDKGEWTWYK